MIFQQISASSLQWLVTTMYQQQQQHAVVVGFKQAIVRKNCLLDQQLCNDCWSRNHKFAWHKHYYYHHTAFYGIVCCHHNIMTCCKNGASTSPTALMISHLQPTALCCKWSVFITDSTGDLHLHLQLLCCCCGSLWCGHTKRKVHTWREKWVWTCTPKSYAIFPCCIQIKMLLYCKNSHKFDPASLS